MPWVPKGGPSEMLRSLTRCILRFRTSPPRRSDLDASDNDHKSHIAQPAKKKSTPTKKAAATIAGKTIKEKEKAKVDTKMDLDDDSDDGEWLVRISVLGCSNSWALES